MSNGVPPQKARLALLLQIIAFLILPLALIADEMTPTVRVGLIQNLGRLTSLTLTSTGEFQIKDTSGWSIDVKAGDNVAISLKPPEIQISVNGTEATPPKPPVRLVPANQDQTFEILSPNVRYSRYRGVLEISSRNHLVIVNELDLEHYLYGVLPVEIPATFQTEAQKALAVAARTYVLRNSLRHKADGYDVCDSVHCQGFCGASREFDWVRKAVDDTRGQVLVFDGELIHACYSADCGGATMNGEDYSPSARLPYLRSVADNPSGKASPVALPDAPAKNDPRRAPASPWLQTPDGGKENQVSRDSENETNADCNPPGQQDQPQDYCAGSPCHEWVITYEPQELAVRLKPWDAKIGNFKSMEFVEYDASDRVKSVLLKGEKGECRITGSQLREALGANKMKSTRAVMSVSPEGCIVIRGKGYGHGLGMCLYGAEGLARSKESITYVDILKHYYTGVEIKSISDIANQFVRASTSKQP